MKGTFITILIVRRPIKGGHIHCVEGLNTKEHWLSKKKSSVIRGRKIILGAPWTCKLFTKASRRFTKGK